MTVLSELNLLILLQHLDKSVDATMPGNGCQYLATTRAVVEPGQWPSAFWSTTANMGTYFKNSEVKHTLITTYFIFDLSAFKYGHSMSYLSTSNNHDFMS
jgi:hypothetical protein